MENALQKNKWDLMGLSEVRRAGENHAKRKNDDYFYHFGETKGQNRIGFCVRGDIWNEVYEIKRINEGIGLIKTDYGMKWI